MGGAARGYEASAYAARAACIGRAACSIIVSGSGACRPTKKEFWRCCVRMSPLTSTQMVERLSSHLSSSEIFTALFELELSGRIQALPGKYYVRSM